MRMNKVCGTKPQPSYPIPTGFTAFEAVCINSAANMACVPMVNAASQPKQREYTMIDQEMDQRRYIVDRLYTILRQKDVALEEFFGLRDDSRPGSPEDMIKRIQDGKYVLEAKDEFDDADDESFSYGNFERLHWRDPSKVRDQAGYKAAEKNLKAASQKLQDKARLYTIADATKAFEEFQATDFTTVH